MFGSFQQSHLRIEVPASAQALRESLLYPANLQQLLAPVRLSDSLPEQLQPGMMFTTWLGPIAIQHTVDRVEPNRLRLLLAQGIDGVHDWQWGEGWVQSRLEGVSLLPIALGQTVSLMRLRQVVSQA